MTGISIGGPAPDFTLRDQFGQDVTLSSYRGTKAVLLVFYPYAFSNVCTGEMAQIRSRLDEFITFDSEILAISCDATHALRAFSDADGLNFPLLSDPDRKVLTAWGAYGEKKMYGKTVQGVIRSTFVVDEKGKVEVAQYNVKATGHVAKLRRDLGLDA